MSQTHLLKVKQAPATLDQICRATTTALPSYHMELGQSLKEQRSNFPPPESLYRTKRGNRFVFYSVRLGDKVKKTGRSLENKGWNEGTIVSRVQEVCWYPHCAKRQTGGQKKGAVILASIDSRLHWLVLGRDPGRGESPGLSMPGLFSPCGSGHHLIT